MTSSNDLDDLRALARRGELSAADKRRLARGFATSLEDRILEEAGQGFDAEASVQVDDVEMVGRLVRRLERRQPRPRRRPRIRFAAGVGIGVLLAATVAAGLEVVNVVVPLEILVPVGVRVQGGEASARAISKPRRPWPAPRIASPADSTLDGPKAEAPVPAPSARDKASLEAAAARSAPPTKRSSAASAPVGAERPGPLFRQANRARARGDVSAATALYRRLLERFPTSVEARAAQLSLGMLYLQSGQPAAALTQFRRYRHAGALNAEALFGEAEAYRRLGRRKEERQVLQELVQRYPRSAYSVSAAKRLSEATSE